MSVVDDLRNGWRRTEARFWRQVAAKVEPHLPPSIQIDGINVRSAGEIRDFTISGVNVRAVGERPGITLQGRSGPPREGEG